KQGGRDGAEPQGALRTFYQRMDLSGDYTVEQDGAISIPLLGRFQVEGRGLDDVRADLAVSFTTVIWRSANIDVKIFYRSPIYVVGPVKNPGAYKYVPGMIVLHAIALAGGLDRGEGNLSSMVEGARELERQRSMTLQVKQLLARRARLEAERDGSSTLPIPIQLAKLVWDAAGERTARTFLATESTILRAEQARRRQQGKETASRFAATRNEVEALLATESTVLRAEQARRRQQDKEIASRFAATRNEVEALLATESTVLRAEQARRRQQDKEIALRVAA